MRIACLAPRAESAFNPNSTEQTGGAERQLSYLARAMHDLGHQVDLLVAGNGEGPIRGEFATIWPIFPLTGIPILKLIHPKGTTLYRFLRGRGSQILLQRGASELTAIAATAAAVRGIPFNFLLASDRDLQPGNEILPHPQDKVLYHEALRRSSRIIAQTDLQADLLQRQYGRRGEVIPSFANLPDSTERFPSEGEAIIWGGNLRRIKRPEWLLSLAKIFPERRFIVFGGAAAGSEQYAEGIVHEMGKLPNIKYLGAVQPEQLPGIYREGGILINTSSEEGFPNTFLEAWHYGLQVLATVDPDKLLSVKGLGIKVASVEEMADSIRYILRRGEREGRIHLDNARKYLKRTHSRDILARRWESCLREQLTDGKLPTG